MISVKGLFRLLKSPQNILTITAIVLPWVVAIILISLYVEADVSFSTWYWKLLYDLAFICAFFAIWGVELRPRSFSFNNIAETFIGVLVSLAVLSQLEPYLQRIPQVNAESQGYEWGMLAMVLLAQCVVTKAFQRQRNPRWIRRTPHFTTLIIFVGLSGAMIIDDTRSFNGILSDTPYSAELAHFVRHQSFDFVLEYL